MTSKQVTCPRCDGTGHIAEYAHVRDGICFKCSGTGKVAAPRKPSKKQMEAKARREAEREVANAIHARRIAKAEDFYKSDPRLRVSTDHPYYFAHAYELAMLDKNWERW